MPGRRVDRAPWWGGFHINLLIGKEKLMSIALDVIYMGLPDLLGAAVSALGLGISSGAGKLGMTWGTLVAVPAALALLSVARPRRQN